MAGIKTSLTEMQEENLDEYEVDQILDHRAGQNETEFLVKWMGNFDDTWEPRSGIVNGTNVLASYWAKALDSCLDSRSFCEENFVDLAPLYKLMILKAVYEKEEFDDIEGEYLTVKSCPEKVPKKAMLAVLSYEESIKRIEALMKGAKKRRQSYSKKAKTIAPLKATKGQVLTEIEKNLEEKAGCSKHLSNDAQEVGCTNTEEISGADLAIDMDGGSQIGGADAGKVSEGSANLKSDVQVVEENCDDTASETESSSEGERFACVHPKCGKSFGTKKALQDHSRYHKVAKCWEANCKWRGFPKRFNSHIARAHGITTLAEIKEARKNSGLDKKVFGS